MEVRVYNLGKNQAAPTGSKGTWFDANGQKGILWIGLEGTFPSNITSEIVTLETWQAYLKQEAARVAKIGIEALAEYASLERDEWQNEVQIAQKAQDADDAVPGSGDWSYFEALTPVGMTAREYGQEALAKHTALQPLLAARRRNRKAHFLFISAMTEIDTAYDVTAAIE